MKINVMKATIAQLNILVAMCDGLNVVHYRTWLETENDYWKGKDCSFADSSKPFRYITEDGKTGDIAPYATSWQHGGPIVEREGLTVMRYSPSCVDVTEDRTWYACEDIHWDEYQASDAEGPTPLIAAMRCYVMSKLGKEVEVANELMEVV